MKTLLILLPTIALLLALPDKTTRQRLRVDTAAVADRRVATADTIALAAGDVTVSAYDKPLRSTGESMCVTSNRADTLLAVEVELDYRDRRGRQLHKRRAWLEFDGGLPPGETRRADIPAWDKRQAYYYINGVRPRRTDNVAAFDVTVTPLRAVLPLK